MIEFVQDWLFANWGKLLWGVTFLAFIPAYIQARYLWRSRRFLTRMNFSLNILDGNTLRFRTLKETNLADAMLNNTHAIRVIHKTPRSEGPGAFLLFRDKEEAWTILNTVLNDLSSGFAEGFVARSMNLPTQSEWYFLGISCEKHSDLRNTKYRVMIVAESALEKIVAYDDLQFEEPRFHIRLSTLKQMWQLTQDEKLRHNIIRVELTVKV